MYTSVEQHKNKAHQTYRFWPCQCQQVCFSTPGQFCLFLSNGRSCHKRRNSLPIFFPPSCSSRSGPRRNSVPGLLLTSLLPSDTQGSEKSSWAQPNDLCYAGVLLGVGETFPPTPCSKVEETPHCCKPSIQAPFLQQKFSAAPTWWSSPLTNEAQLAGLVVTSSG